MSEMEAFDQLPKSLRDLLRESEHNLSAVQTLAVYRRFGEYAAMTVLQRSEAHYNAS